jgi:adenylate cyclase
LSAGVLVLTILLGLITSQWIITPIKRVTKASNEIAKGNLNQKIQPSMIVEVASLSRSFNIMTVQLKDSLEALRLANEELESRVEERTGELRREKERSEQLLLNILPEEIADRLMRTNESPAEHFEEATILFADIVGFTSLSARLEPLQLVAGLNQIFSAFDHLTEKYGLEKIKTIGDAYMVVGGLPVSRPDHAEAIAEMALDMQDYMQNLENIFGESLQIRIGINTGPVIAGVIGIKKFIYDLWGDAVNVASRMESHGKPGSIQVTEATYDRLKDKFILESRGAIEVKGRGEMMTYWLIGRQR